MDRIPNAELKTVSYISFFFIERLKKITKYLQLFLKKNGLFHDCEAMAFETPAQLDMIFASCVLERFVEFRIVELDTSKVLYNVWCDALLNQLPSYDQYPNSIYGESFNEV